MKSSLDRLPAGKRRELEHVQAVLMREFEAAIAGGTQPWRRNGKILKVILFGSFGRGDWVDDRRSGYQSDWDLLIIVNQEKLTAIEDYWSIAEDKLLRDPRVKRVVNVIVHTLQQVNEALTKGEYFWLDIQRDGVLLYELPSHPLATPQPLTPADAYEMATRYFAQKSADIGIWLENARSQVLKADKNIRYTVHAAFNLHQSVETAYACFLLVRTFYLPHSHNIKFLRSLSEDLDKRLIPAWPRATKKDERLFKLLKRAYVEARYSEHYEISADDLETLTGHAGELRTIVEDVCRERLEALGDNRG